MKTFDLEIRVKTFGSVITSKVYLEDLTNESYKLTDWQQADGYRYKKLPNYKIIDETLEVFAACNGIAGGTLTCEVLINEVLQDEKIIAKTEQKKFSIKSYKI